MLNPTELLTQNALHLDYLYGAFKNNKQINKRRLIAYLGRNQTSIETIFPNLAESAEYQEIIEKLRTPLSKTSQKTFDTNFSKEQGFFIFEKLLKLKNDEDPKYKLFRPLIYKLIDTYKEKNGLAIHPESVNTSVNNSTNASLYAPFIRSTTITTTGTVMVGFIAVMHLHPKFALLVGSIVSPPALTALAITGLVIASYGLYHSIKTYGAMEPIEQAQASSTLYKGLLAKGLGMIGFASLMHFNPQFALMLGLQFTPLSLICMGTMGGLFLAISMYHLFQTSKIESNILIDVTPVDPAIQANTLQSLISYFGSFRSNTNTTNAVIPEQTSDNDRYNEMECA